MNKLDEVLFDHGIYPNYKGYEYIKSMMQYDKSIALLNITDKYKSEAIKFNTTPGAIERAIRNIISKSDFDKTTNKQFLAMLQIEYRGDNYEI